MRWLELGPARIDKLCWSRFAFLKLFIALFFSFFCKTFAPLLLLLILRESTAITPQNQRPQTRPPCA